MAAGVHPVMLTLILPGVQEVLSSNPASAAPRLEKWAARALPAPSPGHCYEQAILQALGYAVPDITTLPAANCTWLTDFDESAPQACCRADPVHLKTDKDHARLIPVDSLDLALAESREIVSALNEHFGADGIQFAVGQKGRWYIAGVDAPVPDTQPTSQVAGRNVASFLPGSPATARWRQIATEVQMLLHTLPVNQQRESRGLPAINSLWFWGGSKLPAIESVSECKVFSNAAFAVGAGKLTGIRVYPLEEVMAGLPPALFNLGLSRRFRTRQSAGIVVLDTRLLEGILSGDQAVQQSVLNQLENGLLDAVDKLLLRGQLRQLRIDTCDGRSFQLSRGGLFRLWKKSRPLASS